MHKQRTISALVRSSSGKLEFQLQYLQWHHSRLKLNISFFSFCWQHQLKDWVTARQRCWVRLLAARKAQSNSTYPFQPSPQSKNYVIHKYAKHHAETTEALARSLCRIASGQALLLCYQQIRVLRGQCGQVCITFPVLQYVHVVQFLDCTLRISSNIITCNHRHDWHFIEESLSLPTYLLYLPYLNSLRHRFNKVLPLSWCFTKLRSGYQWYGESLFFCFSFTILFKYIMSKLGALL